MLLLGSYFAQDAAYSHMYTDQPSSRASQHRSQPGAAALSQSAMVFNLPPPPSHHQLAAGAAAASATTQMIFQAFPGSNHAVSVAALHSCRFAHLQGSLLSPGSSGSAASTSASGPTSYPMSLSNYWLGASGLVSPAAPPPAAPAPASSHVHTMFLARVLVGEFTVGKNMYRKPPPMDSSQPFGRCYDSCVNDTNKPTIFVIFNNAQCYPEYIIEYTNKPRNSL